MNQSELHAVKEIIKNFAPKTYYYDCDYKIAKEGELINTKCVVNATDSAKATRKLRGDFRKHNLLLIRFKDLTIQ